MKRLFLASQLDQSLGKLLTEFGVHPETTELVFITTAANPEGRPLEERSSWKAINALGFDARDLDIEGKSRQEIDDAIAEADIVVLGGGNTFYLLDQLRKTGADGLLTDFVDRGILVGSSAGSIVCGPDIEYVESLDEPDAAPDLKETVGLGLIPWYVVPHVGRAEFEPVPEMVNHRYGDLDLIFLTDEQAVVVMDEDARVV